LQEITFSNLQGDQYHYGKKKDIMIINVKYFYKIVKIRIPKESPSENVAGSV
jgi:hypothetical protein